MDASFFYKNNNEIDEASVTAALAATGVNILGVTRGQSCVKDSTFGEHYRDYYTINFEFQWRSRGNYIWSKTTHTTDNGLTEGKIEIYNLVRSLRDQLEDPRDRGKYRYLEEE